LGQKIIHLATLPRGRGCSKAVPNSLIWPENWWRKWDQGCQMVCFQTKNLYLGRFWRALKWKMLVYFMVIWNNLRPFGIFLWTFGTFYGQLVYFCPFGYIVSRKIWQPWVRSHCAARTCEASPKDRGCKNALWKFCEAL
jgi:hypothetical protein